MRRIALAAVLAAAALAVAAPDALSGDKPKKNPHPLYDDHGTLDWFPKLAQAQKAAKERRKLIFIEFGRES